jgi:Fe-S cluster biosynthesis and repair protein YggX
MSHVNCTRCGEPGDQLKQPPLPTDLGDRIYDSVCHDCWGEWLRQQTAIINHYGLDLTQPDSRKFLLQQTEQFLFGPSGG